MLRRTKLREQYLQKLAAEGKIHADRPPKPDPERWLPRKQRSYNKRGKRRNQFLGAQGSGDGGFAGFVRLPCGLMAGRFLIGFLTPA
eukprot:5528275-Prorocentrum_lima.AAC.1